MTKFADNLLHDLMDEHGSTLAAMRRPAPRRRHPARIAAGVVAAGAAATTGVLVLGGSPAYALTDNPDGTVTLKIDRASGIPEANQAFKARDERVVVVPVRSGCPDIGSFVTPADPATSTTSTTSSARVGESDSITIQVTGLPAGRIALVAVDTEGKKMTMSVAMIKGPAPECVSLPTVPPPGAIVESRTP